MFTSRIACVSPDLATQIFGLKDQNLRELRERFSVDVIYRDGEIRVSGESQAVLNATKMLELLRQEAERHGSVTSFGTSSNDASSNTEFPIGIQSPIDIVQTGREIRPKTAGQQKYADAIREFDIVFSSESRQILSRTITNLSISHDERAGEEISKNVVLPRDPIRSYVSNSSVSVARIKWEELNSYEHCSEVNR